MINVLFCHHFYLNSNYDCRFDLAVDSARSVDRIVTSLTSVSQPTSPSPSVQSEMLKETPLLGVPFSFCDGIKARGFRHTLGVVSRRTRLSPSDAECVRLLRESGAVPVCSGNVSELGLWWGDCHNGVAGTTNNPYDIRRLATQINLYMHNLKNKFFSSERHAAHAAGAPACKRPAPSRSACAVTAETAAASSLAPPPAGSSRTAPAPVRCRPAGWGRGIRPRGRRTGAGRWGWRPGTRRTWRRRSRS